MSASGRKSGRGTSGDGVAAALATRGAVRPGFALRPRVVRFAGYNLEGALALMHNASLFVDANLPGLEAAVSEFGFFGAVPLISPHLFGSEHSPVLPRLPADSLDVDTHADVILDVLADLGGFRDSRDYVRYDAASWARATAAPAPSRI